MQAEPTPTPTPPGNGGGGPSVDVGAIVNGIVNGILNGFQTMVSGWAVDLPKNILLWIQEDMAKGWNGLWNSGANLFNTPRELTIGFPPAVQLAIGTNMLVYSIVFIAIVLLALRNILRTITGHGGTLDEAVNGVLIGTLLAGSSWLLMDQAYGLAVLGSWAFGRMSYAPSMPLSASPSLALSIIVLIVMFIFSFKLWVRAAYRIVLLMFLAPLAPIAGALWAIPQTKWVTVLYFTTVGGWLAGGFLALGALSLGVQLATIGNTNAILALIFGIALVQIAYDLMNLLARGFQGTINGGGGLRSFLGGAAGAAVGGAAGAAVGGTFGGAAAGVAEASAGTALATTGGLEMAGYGY